jgi:hypothetical protein
MLLIIKRIYFSVCNYRRYVRLTSSFQVEVAVHKQIWNSSLQSARVRHCADIRSMLLETHLLRCKDISRSMSTLFQALTLQLVVRAKNLPSLSSFRITNRWTPRKPNMYCNQDDKKIFIAGHSEGESHAVDRRCCGRKNSSDLSLASRSRRAYV